MRTIRRRRLKFSPKIATTMRPHGKWGDLLACLIPLSWCVNILINSSFLLKLIEWQNESSLFTVKIRGKQWYWLYRIDFKNFTKIVTAPKNIGHNKWVLFTHGNTKQSDDYLSALHLRRQSNWMTKFWTDAFTESESNNMDQPMNLSFYQTINDSIKNLINNASYNQNSVFIKHKPEWVYTKSSFNVLNAALSNDLIEGKSVNTRNIFNSTMYATLYSFENFKNPKSEELGELSNSIKSLSDCSDHWLGSNFSNIPANKLNPSNNSNSLVFGSNPEETTRTYRKKVGSYDPINIRPTYISDDSVDSIKDGTSSIVYMVEPSDIVSNVIEKPCLYENFLVRKQKRYKFRKSIGPNKFTLSRKVIKDINSSLKPGSPKVEELFKDIKARLILGRDNQISMASDHSSPTRKYKMFKLNKKKTEVNNLNVNRRMLRTRRTLILPAHVNITAVTNSFDVIHSWFIPGLGLKMDCIPGRATHHTFFIDNVGFYYGQCAEVCGRYHHHMPIRVCALPFDHFLLWWHHFGARRFLKPVVNKPGEDVDQLKKESEWRTSAKAEYKLRTGVSLDKDPKSLRKRHLNAYALRKYSW